MGIAVWALIVYIGVIIFWAVVVKRNMAGGMLIGFILTGVFAGSRSIEFLLEGLLSALNNEVLFASLAFVLMSYLIKESELLDGILKIFHALLGNFVGGPAFVNIGLSAVMGMLSGSNSANTATSGAFTAQWMIESGWDKETAAALIAGNGGLGAGFPPSASMFIMLGFAQVNNVISEGMLYVGLFVAGIYQVIYRVILVTYLIKKMKIKHVLEKKRQPLGASLKENWQSLLVFLGAIIPILITVGPVGVLLKKHGLSEAISSISLLIWIPILMILIILLLGWKKLRKNINSREKLVNSLIPLYKNIGGLLLFAFAASEVLSALGLADELILIFENLHFSKPIMILLVGLLVVLVAGPLSSTATLTSIGLIAYTALVSVGVTPLSAVVSILVFASTEGASPPASGSIFIASGLTECRAEKTFYPLIKYFVVPITILGWLIAMGWLPLFS